MYEHMLENYWVYFEGLPEPVFYGRYYPTGDKDGPYNAELWSDCRYAWGLKNDKDPDGKYLREFGDRYEADLRSLLNNVYFDSKGMRRGAAVIPSSTKNVVNRTTSLVRRVLASSPGVFDDLTQTVVRSRDKMAAHTGGSRSYSSNFDTLDVSPSASLSKYDLILVIDDILTTGKSFRAMNDKLRACGFSGQIVNFAFSRTLNGDGPAICKARKAFGPEIEQDRRSRASFNYGHPIEAIVFDLDQTLLNDGLRGVSFEERAAANRTTDPFPYSPYSGVEQLMELCIPYAVVSNRPDYQLYEIVRQPIVEAAIYPYLRMRREGAVASVAESRVRSYFKTACPAGSNVLLRAKSLPRNVFTFPEALNGAYKVRYYKPSPRGVNGALSYLREEFLGNREDARVIGVGNTLEDVIAYDEAGIESVLALWGVPEAMRDYARDCWGADHVFDSVAAFTKWVKTNTAYCEMAQSVEGTDPDRAREYYELAVRCGDDVMVAAFRLARMYHGSDPARAIPLYEMAIDAGDEYASTNNLGLLVQDDDPERAMALFERAIAAGEEEHATLNLARLIGANDAPRAVELLERAAAAGNGGALASDLEPLIRGGSEEAAALYEKEVVSKDGKMANTLAIWVKDHDPERAASLYRRAIAAGDEFHATRNLALLLRDDDPETALEMLARAAEAGNAENLAADLEPMIRSGVEGAATLYERLIVAPDEKRAFNLAQMVSADDPERAKELYERAIAAGDERYATYGLGAMLMDEDPERAKGLFRRAMDAGSEQLATNALGLMVADEDPDLAHSLYERAIAAGDERYAPVNLARLLQDDDPQRALDLVRRAAKTGRTDLGNALKPLVLKRIAGAIDLYEATVVAANGKLANDLAELVKTFAPERARRLYEQAIAAGDEEYATNNLALLIKKDDPDRATALFERAIAAGDNRYAPSNLGTVVAAYDLDRAIGLFEEACAAGETRCAPCNLAHMYAPTDPERAIGLYEKSAACGEPEAVFGLAYLLRDLDVEKSKALLDQVRTIDDREKVVASLLELVGYASMETAMEMARFLYAEGFAEAGDALVALVLGEGKRSADGGVLLGISPTDGKPIEWIMVEQEPDSILLLSKESLKSMPFCEGAPSATWEDSEVRKWLNSEFIKTAFNNETYDSFIAHQGTGDMAFCLSEDEIEGLGLDHDSALVCMCRNTATRSKWWLRPSNGSTMSAPCITEDGNKSWSLALLSHGVRPAIRVSLRKPLVGRDAAADEPTANYLPAQRRSDPQLESAASDAISLRFLDQAEWYEDMPRDVRTRIDDMLNLSNTDVLLCDFDLLEYAAHALALADGPKEVWIYIDPDYFGGMTGEYGDDWTADVDEWFSDYYNWIEEQLGNAGQAFKGFTSIAPKRPFKQARCYSGYKTWNVNPFDYFATDAVWQAMLEYRDSTAVILGSFLDRRSGEFWDGPGVFEVGNTVPKGLAQVVEYAYGNPDDVFQWTKIMPSAEGSSQQYIAQTGALCHTELILYFDGVSETCRMMDLSDKQSPWHCDVTPLIIASNNGCLVPSMYRETLQQHTKSTIR